MEMITEQMVAAIHGGNADISENTLLSAEAWIDNVDINNLRDKMKTEDWQANVVDKEEIDSFSDMELRELAKAALYEDSSYVVETIVRCMEGVILEIDPIL